MWVLSTKEVAESLNVPRTSSRCLFANVDEQTREGIPERELVVASAAPMSVGLE
jgi:hypothetical protein